MIEDDRDRDGRPDEADRGNEGVRSGLVGEPEVRVVRDRERRQERD
ncbi:hypothetical protein [Natrinema hispanicum]|nr:hypothetical protein [Natrinema hispanicum]